MIAVKIEKNGY